MKTVKYDISKENSMDDHQGNDEGQGSQVANACIQCFKLCCKKKANFGLEDLFWLSFLVLIIILSVVKSTTRIGWSQFIYVICGSVIGLIVVYLSASIINKFCFDDAATAHWNAHARFTQAALAQRLGQEEHKVHVIAPPRMGGAKLNILYTVGDVPISVPQKGVQPPSQPLQSPTKNSCPAPLTRALSADTPQTPPHSALPSAHKNSSSVSAVDVLAVDPSPARDQSAASQITQHSSAAYVKTTDTLYEEQERF